MHTTYHSINTLSNHSQLGRRHLVILNTRRLIFPDPDPGSREYRRKEALCHRANYRPAAGGISDCGTRYANSGSPVSPRCLEACGGGIVMSRCIFCPSKAVGTSKVWFVDTVTWEN